MEKNNNYPTIMLELDFDNSEMGVNTVSFVESPAFKLDWQKFSEAKEFKFEKNEMERIVTGPIMIPNQPIYRFSDTIGPFYVKFTENTISNTMKKYMKDTNGHNVNEEHNQNKRLNNVYLVESFITGKRANSTIYKDIPEGTWMGSFFIEDEKYWDEVIMSDTFGGLSLEGVFDLKYEDEIVSQVYSEIEEVLFSDVSEDEKLIKINKLLNIK